MDREKVINGIQCRLELKCSECPYTSDDDVCDDCDSLFQDVLELLNEQETVEHALDVLQKNGWKEEAMCEKCTLLTAVSDGVHEMAKQFRMGGETITLIKEQEEKPLRCEKCSYHREDGWCSEHKQYVKETDYCSLGAWEGR